MSPIIAAISTVSEPKAILRGTCPEEPTDPSSICRRIHTIKSRGKHVTPSLILEDGFDGEGIGSKRIRAIVYVKHFIVIIGIAASEADIAEWGGDTAVGTHRSQRTGRATSARKRAGFKVIIATVSADTTAVTRELTSR